MLPAKARASAKTTYDDDKEQHDPEAWKAFNGDTEAGRLLAKLYGGQAKSKINYPVLKTRPNPITKPFIPGGAKNFKANCRTDSKIKQKQARTNIPRAMGPGGDQTSDVPRWGAVDCIPKRRGGDVIKHQTAEYERTNVETQGFVKPISSEEQKHRLQKVNTYGGGKALPAEMLPSGKGDIDTVKAVSQKQTPEQLFDAITLEIEERKKFLDDMNALGKGEEFKYKIQKEIQERVADMEMLMKHMG